MLVLVPRAAWLYSFLNSGFGYAGKLGFLGGDEVHTLANHDDICDACFGGAALVHNAPFSGGHSTFFSTVHCDRFWLPFLLGYDPAEHKLVVEMCSQLCELDGLG